MAYDRRTWGRAASCLDVPDVPRLFLDDPKLPLDNDIAERALRISALGRKSFLFAAARRPLGTSPSSRVSSRPVPSMASIPTTTYETLSYASRPIPPARSMASCRGGGQIPSPPTARPLCPRRQEILGRTVTVRITSRSLLPLRGPTPRRPMLRLDAHPSGTRGGAKNSLGTPQSRKPSKVHHYFTMRGGRNERIRQPCPGAHPVRITLQA